MLTTSQRRTYLDTRSVFRPGQKDARGDSSSYVEVAGEQDKPCHYVVTPQFDTRTSVAGVTNKDNLMTADSIYEESGRDTRAGDLIKVVQAGSLEVQWFTVKGGTQRVPTRGSARANFQQVFLAASPAKPTAGEPLPQPDGTYRLVYSLTY